MKKEMLASITPDTCLDDAFFRSMYCKGMDNPDFPEQAITALEAAGHSKAREQYKAWVQQYEAEYEETLKQVAHWYAKETEKFYERWVREAQKQQRAEREVKNTVTRNRKTEYQFGGFPEDW